MKRLITKDIDNATVISIDGDVEFEDSVKLTQTIENIYSDHSINIIMDMAKCNYIDSYGLGVFANTFKKIKKANGHFMLCNLTEDCKEIMMMTMLYKYMFIYKSVNDCVNFINN